MREMITLTWDPKTDEADLKISSRFITQHPAPQVSQIEDWIQILTHLKAIAEREADHVKG